MNSKRDRPSDKRLDRARFAADPVADNVVE